MKEHPILFKGDMVRAILAGRKTETRRIIKPQPDEHGYWKHREGHMVHNCDLHLCCPYGQAGDRLWVRETWTKRADGNIAYKAGPYPMDVKHDICKWKPSIHMFRKYSRITLEITKISVERVQDITDGSVAKEGIDWSSTQIGNKHRSPAIDKFASLWDSINKKRGYPWESNPWVWVIKFKKDN